MNKRLLFIICLIFFSYTTMPVFAVSNFDENNYLLLQETNLKLKSNLSNDYNAYSYVLLNKYDKPVVIQNVYIWNNSNGKVAYLSTKQNSKELVNNVINQGKKYALPTFSLSLFGSVFAVPFVAVKNHIANNKMEKEANDFVILQKFPLELKPNQKLTMKTLALNKHHPSIRVVFVNPITDENMSLQLIK